MRFRTLAPIAATLAFLLGAIGATAQEGDAMAPEPAAPTHTNRLASENSPYLLQHAHNPVDWWPWGQEAFDEARRRDVPIFLSVGYSTCYWCHVMERESFENEDIAAILNAKFVPVKVDREQRPDVDTIYMHAIQALTGRGGWPMSVFLTPPGARGEDDPGLEPYWGGTYFPPESRYNIPAFGQVLEAMSNAWQTRREDALEQADTVVKAIRHELEAETRPVRLTPEAPAQAAVALQELADPTNGGFGSAPKFPQPVYLEFLIDSLPFAQDPSRQASLDDTIRKALDAMALGGVNDQVGGGFHRYSVDAMWRVPHFEKMLYDNGQLAALYARAARVFEDPMYVRVARETCDYVLREMTSPDGVFYSAQDAEVNEREGQNYVWTREQMAEALEGDDLALALDIYGVADGPNFQDPHHPEDGAVNVLFLRARPEVIAQEKGISVDALIDRIEHIDALLLAARQNRDQPSLDDKVIVAWNGLMIAGLAETALATDDVSYLVNAEKAARFILENFRNDDGRLQRTMRDGRLAIDAVFEDYSFLIKGLLTAHRARQTLGGDAQWLLDAAIDLTREARAAFAEEATGAWYDTRADRTDLIVRVRSTDDGAVPAPGTVMAMNLLDLYERTEAQEFRDDAGRLVASLSQRIARSPAHPINATRALVRILNTDVEMITGYGFGPDAPHWRDIGPANREGEFVQVFADKNTVTIPAQGSVELTIRLVIAKGSHVNAHEPGIEGLTGLKIELLGAAGIEAVVDYPEGELYEGVAINPVSDQRLSVYTGIVEIPIEIVRTGALIVGTPKLEITYQVCTETECLPAKVGTIDVQFKAEN